MTKDDFEEWQENPITRVVLGHIKNVIKGLRDNRSEELEKLLAFEGNEGTQKKNRLVFESGMITFGEDLLNLTFEDIV